MKDGVNVHLIQKDDGVHCQDVVILLSFCFLLKVVVLLLMLMFFFFFWTFIVCWSMLLSFWIEMREEQKLGLILLLLRCYY